MLTTRDLCWAYCFKVAAWYSWVFFERMKYFREINVFFCIYFFVITVNVRVMKSDDGFFGDDYGNFVGSVGIYVRSDFCGLFKIEFLHVGEIFILS